MISSTTNTGKYIPPHLRNATPQNPDSLGEKAKGTYAVARSYLNSQSSRESSNSIYPSSIASTSTINELPMGGTVNNHSSD